MINREFFIEKLKKGEIFDVVVVGGGITGSGILRRLAMLGLKVLLLEQKDFAWGTSSRSGKLVHGGLRYIKQDQLLITYHSVREREKLLRAYKKLIFPLRFAVPLEDNYFIKKAVYRVGLSIYDLFAMKRTSCYVSNTELLGDFKFLNNSIYGGYTFFDAVTDDVKLTFQVLLEALEFGALAINYAKVAKIDKVHEYYEILFEDEVSGEHLSVPSNSVVVATGAWIDEFNPSFSIRKLKGSHLVLPFEKMPIRYACAVFHPNDRRPLYVIPWSGSVIFGTTDIDYDKDLNNEIKISEREVEYLFEALDFWFPKAKIERKDIISTFSGVRGVLNTHKKDPSKETRDYILEIEDSIVFVSGGKLTTFDYISRKVAKKIFKLLNKNPKGIDFNRLENSKKIAMSVVSMFDKLFWNSVKNTHFSELIKNSFVVHLDDLLIRRSRLGLTSSDGGFKYIENEKQLIMSALDWSSEEYENEFERYKSVLRHYKLDG